MNQNSTKQMQVFSQLHMINIMQQQKKQFAVLSYTIFVTGLYLNSYGVLIPFYSSASQHDETFYSFLFIVRSIAYISGSILVKYLACTINTQMLYKGIFITMGISLFICSLSFNPVNLALMLYISGVCNVSQMIVGMSLTIKLFQKDRPDFWLTLLGFFFGVGASIAPLISMIFGLHTYKILAIFCALVIFFQYLCPLPNLGEQDYKQQGKKSLSRKSQIFIALILMIFPAQQIGFVSWLPTYSIKASIATTEGAGIYSFYFWISNTIARLIWAFWITCSVTLRLKVIQIAITVASFILVVLQQLQQYQMVCIFSSIIYGIMLTCVYSYCLALPIDNGFQVGLANNANFVLANCIGEGLLIGPMGYSMSIFGFQSLVIVMLISCIFSSWCFQMSVVSMRNDKKEDQTQEIMLQDMS